MESKSKTPIVLLFNQITPNVINDFVRLGYLYPDGSPTGLVEFRISSPPFNTRLEEKNPTVKTFIDSCRSLKTAYSMPAFGDALFALVQNPIATRSIMPYHLGIDDFVVSKAGPAWETVCRWLSTVDLPEAKTVIQRGSDFMAKALSYVKEHSHSLTLEQHRRELLVPLLGEHWREVSGNLNTAKFLVLFGATEDLNKLFAAAKGPNHKNEVVQIINDARWVANFINLFKPTTEFKLGATSDMLNFAAMFSGISFNSKLTDRDAVKALESFNPNNPDLSRVVEAHFDMEPDDIGAMTAVMKHCPNAIIIRTYPSQAIADMAEKFLATRVKFTQGSIHIDPLLENGKVLTELYTLASKSI